MSKAFRDLEVWQLSLELADQIYELTEKFPKQEMFGLTSQMRRAAVSIASNIAEGSSRISNREFRNFLRIAIGNDWELQTQLLIAARRGFISQQQLQAAEATCQRVARMLSGLSKYLKSKHHTDNREPTTDNPEQAQ